MSRPAFVPERGEIWYSDANSGFYALRVTNGVWPFTEQSAENPGEARCRSQRNFLIHLFGFARARVTVDGRRVWVRRGGRWLTARVDLRGKPKKTVVVRIRGVDRSGRARRDVRRYRTCTPGRPG